jgi:hypothetical protein
LDIGVELLSLWMDVGASSAVIQAGASLLRALVIPGMPLAALLAMVLFWATQQHQ